MTLDRPFGLFATIVCFSLVTGCVSSSPSAGAWREHDNGGRCGYETIDTPEYAFFQFQLEDSDGTNPVANWRLQPGVDPTQLTPEMVSGLRLKPTGDIFERYNTQFQPFVTDDCRRLFLKVGYGMKSLAEERSIFPVADLEVLQSLKGEALVLTEDGARAYSLPAGTELQVEDVLTTVKSLGKKDRRLQIVAKDDKGQSYTLANNRRHFTTAGNSDPKTLAAFKGSLEKLWQLTPSAAATSSEPTYAAHSPSRGYPGGGALQVGLVCTDQGLQVVVDTDTFINQNSRPFEMRIATDGQAPVAIPMTVFSRSSMGGQGPASQALIEQLSQGHFAQVQITTWNGDQIETQLPLLAAKNTIDQTVASCQ